MELSNTFIKINEMVHSKMEGHKKSLLSEKEFLGLTVNLLMYIEAINSLDSPSLSDVAEYLEVSNASASVAVNKLNKAGYLKKEQSFLDRRVSNICLSEKGKDLIRANNNAAKGFMKGFVGSLTNEEQKTLNKVFGKLISAQKKDKV
jgi:DNA-binding MarR family transcriptional regulator